MPQAPSAPFCEVKLSVPQTLDRAPEQLRVFAPAGCSRHPSPPGATLRLAQALHALVTREIESGDLRPAVWDTARRLTNGEEQRAVAAYIRMRVRALLAAHEARQP
jgi:hypothetical protein